MARGARTPRPSYGDEGLSGLLPRVARSIGVPLGEPGTAELPPARGAIVVLVDGLGLELLRTRSGHAPWLSSRLGGDGLSAGFPATTATSMGSFGTGRPPGQHGLVGYQVLDPDTDRLFNELTWQGGPLPELWQPHQTVFELVGAAGRAVTMVAQDYFDGSGLTRAALRGARFTCASDLAGRVDLALAAMRDDPTGLVYLYWGELDRKGHQFGCDSWQWGAELEAVDAQLRRLAQLRPAGVSLTVTADHGMVDVPTEAKTDVATDPELRSGIRVVGGEMRALHLHCEAGAVPDVAATWRARLGSDAWILTREGAIDTGLFGPVDDAVRSRLGDLIVAMKAPIGVYDSRVMLPKVVALVGQHGSLTAAELRIPQIHVPADSAVS